ncbi:uncharacterized protein LOC110236076, partial [Exaiptasia diaphana]|uniref:Uncharacterized protein n=1 Tax=Exaiptasia diaphana TaxID=2652724 RepID=A0A913X0Y8_EXADI
MSTSSSDSENDSDDSEFNYISNYVFEEENNAVTKAENSEETDEDDVYRDEPLADEKWLESYHAEKKKIEERDRELENRFIGHISINSWCKCGRCKSEYLQNSNEYVCCKEIDSCVDALANEEVLEDTQTLPACITNHPGFNTVCLDKWSLKTSAEKFRCRDRSKYKQRGSQ